MLELQYADRDETGRWYTIDQAQTGWLLAECAGGAQRPSGDLRLGIITAVRGGGFDYVDEAGTSRFTAFRRVYAVARPVGQVHSDADPGP